MKRRLTVFDSRGFIQLRSSWFSGAVDCSVWECIIIDYNLRRALIEFCSNMRNWKLQKFYFYLRRNRSFYCTFLLKFRMHCDVMEFLLTFFFFFSGLQRSMPILAITRHHQKPKVATIATEGNPKDLTNSVQSPRRTGAARRFLLESGRLVGAERPRRGPRQLRVFVECLYESSKLHIACDNLKNFLSLVHSFWLRRVKHKFLIQHCRSHEAKAIKHFTDKKPSTLVGDKTVWFEQRWKHGDVGVVERTRAPVGRRNTSRLCNGLGCSGEQASKHEVAITLHSGTMKNVTKKLLCTFEAVVQVHTAECYANLLLFYDWTSKKLFDDMKKRTTSWKKIDVIARNRHGNFLFCFCSIAQPNACVDCVLRMDKFITHIYDPNFFFAQR